MDCKWVCVYKVVSLAWPDRMEVTSLIYPRGSPEGATKLALRKTFQDFRQLHQEASELFSSRVHGTKIGFPQLQESPESCERLLDFCSRFPQVSNSQVFVDFCQRWTTPPTLSPIKSNRVDLSPTHDNGNEDLHLTCNRLLPPSDEQVSSRYDCVTSNRKEGDAMHASMKSVDKLCPKEESCDDSSMPQYLSRAAEDISQAIKLEAEEDYSGCVNHYRNAISTMLQNVPKDPCLKRQESVKRRIYQYVKKTESLIKKEEEESTSCNSSSMPYLRLFGDLADLRSRYKIRRVLAGKVLVCSDTKPGRAGGSGKGTTNNQSNCTVVIKTLQKSSESSSTIRKNKQRSILPIGVPNMCRLLRYYETEDLLCLVLEYIEGGRELYQVVREYLQNANTVDNNNGNTTVPTLSESSSRFPEPSYMSNENQHEDEVFDSLEYVDIEKSVNGGDGGALYCVGRSGIEKINLSHGVDLQGNTSTEDAEDSAVDSCEECGEDYESVRQTNDDASSARSLIDKVSQRLTESSEKTETTGRDALKRLQSIEFMLNSRLVSVSSDASQHQTAEEELVYHHTPSKVSLTPLKDDDASGYGGDGFSSKCSPTSPGGSMACTPEKSSTTFRIDLETGEEDYLRLIRRWATQIFDAVFSLHARGLFRLDLRPENILLEPVSGDVVLTYKCAWACVHKPIICDQAYTAPELSGPANPGPATSVSEGVSDYWSIGVILYEIFTGADFATVFPTGIKTHTPIVFPHSRQEYRKSQSASHLEDLITRLIRPNPVERLAFTSSPTSLNTSSPTSLNEGQARIRKHPFFTSGSCH